MLLLDPKNDYVFKRVFAQRLDLLTDLVNAVRRDVEPITVTEVLNPQISPEDITGKAIVLDIRARDAHGRGVNVEVQVSLQRDFPSRALFYVARTFVEQISQGEHYTQLRSVIGVNLLNFSVFRDEADLGQAQWSFGLVSRHPPHRALEPQLELNFLEIPKLMLQGADLEKSNKALYDWGVFFSNVNGAAMHQVTRAEVKEAFKVLKSMSATSKAREDAEKRIQYVRDLNGMIGAGWDEGRAVGLEIGRAEGKAEGKAELLVRLLNKKFGPLPPDLTARISCASEDQVDAWSEEVLSAGTLGDLFN